jgi:Tfp pilus assembly protein PilF
MSESLENKGLLEERNGNHDNAIERYKESIESYK